MVASDLLDIDNIELWLDLNQVNAFVLNYYTLYCRSTRFIHFFGATDYSSRAYYGAFFCARDAGRGPIPACRSNRDGH